MLTGVLLNANVVIAVFEWISVLEILSFQWWVAGYYGPHGVAVGIFNSVNDAGSESLTRQEAGFTSSIFLV